MSRITQFADLAASVNNVPGNISVQAPNVVISSGNVVFESGNSIIFNTNTTTSGMSITTTGQVLIGTSSTSSGKTNWQVITSASGVGTEWANPIIVTQAYATLAAGAAPVGITVDNSANIYTVNYNNTISKITAQGVTIQNFATLVSNAYPNTIVIDTLGNLYTLNTNNTVSKIAPNGSVAQVFANLTAGAGPVDMAIDPANNLYIANNINRTIVQIAPNGFTQVWATLSSNPIALATDLNSNVYVLNSNGTISKIDNTQTVTQNWATLTGFSPTCITTDLAGNVYTGNGNFTISKISPAATVINAWASLAASYSPVAIIIDVYGNVYTANSNNTVAKFTSNGVLAQNYANLATGAGPSGIIIDTFGFAYTSNQTNNTVSKIVSAGGANVAALPGGGITISSFTGSIGSEVYTTNMFINSVGNVGIGTSTVAAGNALALYGGNLYVNNSVQAINLNLSGSVGVGTSSPAAAVDVYNSIVLQGTGNQAYITLRDNSAGLQGTRIQTAAGTTNFQNDNTGGGSYTTRMTLDAYGNLLVGTQTVAYATTGRAVFNLSGSQQSLIALSVGGSSRGFWYTDGSNNYMSSDATGGSFSIGTGSSNPLQFTVNNTIRAQFTSSGQFLVNTGLTPSGPNVWQVIASPQGGGTQWSYGSSGGGGNVTALSGGGLLFSTYTGFIGAETYSTQLSILASGLVGTANVGGVNSTTTALGFIGRPTSSISSPYTFALSDQGKQVYITSATTVTIPANSSVPFPVGSVLYVIAGPGAGSSIAITSDTMYFGGSAGTTGTRTLAAYGIATITKVTATVWFITGVGLT